MTHNKNQSPSWQDPTGTDRGPGARDWGRPGRHDGRKAAGSCRRAGKAPRWAEPPRGPRTIPRGEMGSRWAPGQGVCPPALWRTPYHSTCSQVARELVRFHRTYPAPCIPRKLNRAHFFRCWATQLGEGQPLCDQCPEADVKFPGPSVPTRPAHGTCVPGTLAQVVPQVRTCSDPKQN